MPALPKKAGESEQSRSVRTAMHEFKRGKLHSGSKAGPKVTKRKQAVAIGLSQARERGADVAPPPRRRKKKA